MDKQYFVGIEYTWGKQNGADQDVETVGGNRWGYLTYEQSLALNGVIVDAMKKLLDDSLELGLEIEDEPAKPPKTFK